MEQFISTLKSKEFNKKRRDFVKRIQFSYEKYCLQKNIHYIPTTFIDTENDEWLSLQICRDNRCECFELIESNYFVCRDHLLLHHCYVGSFTCHKGVGERGAVFCKFTGNDHSKHSAICSEIYSVPNEDVDTFQDGYTTNNRSNNSANSYTKTPTYVKKSEFLFQNLKRNVDNIVYTILNTTLRKQHNEIVSKSKALKNNILPIYDEQINKDCFTYIITDVLFLCETILCNAYNKKKTLLLLKNIKSFTCYMLAVSMKGLFIRGKVIRNPCVYSKKFHPMPCNVMLKRIFNIKLTKYAECMKCLQTIMEEKSFLAKRKK